MPEFRCHLDQERTAFLSGMPGSSPGMTKEGAEGGNYPLICLPLRTSSISALKASRLSLAVLT
jgi:hypothetical protein